jgi:hypothetical protein
VLALDEGFHLGDLYDLGLLGLGLALFVAVGALIVSIVVHGTSAAALTRLLLIRR